MAVMNTELQGTAAPSGFQAEWWTPRLAGPVIAAAVVRLTLLAVVLARHGADALNQDDTFSYLEPGRNLLLHGRFFADGVPDLLRTPGYPLFLAVTSLGGLSVAAVANVLLSVFSVILVWRLGRTVSGDSRVALGAAWIFAFEPVSITFSVFLLSETLFLTLFLLSLERLTAFLDGGRLPVLAAAGVWLAAATFVRPVTYYLPVALALGLFFVLARVPRLRWKAPAVLLISVLPWLAAWQMRNWMETGYQGFTSVTDINLYYFCAAKVTAEVQHRNYFDLRRELGYDGGRGYGQQAYLYQPYLALHPEQATWNQAQRLAFIHSEATGIIRQHSKIYLRICLKSLFTFLTDLGTGNINSLLNPDDQRRLVAVVNEGLDPSGSALSNANPAVVAEKAVLAIVLLGLYFLAAWGGFRGGIKHMYLSLLLGVSMYFLVLSSAAGGGRFAFSSAGDACCLHSCLRGSVLSSEGKSTAGMKALVKERTPGRRSLCDGPDSTIARAAAAIG
jgi:hypothetical protein